MRKIRKKDFLMYFNTAVSWLIFFSFCIRIEFMHTKTPANIEAIVFRWYSWLNHIHDVIVSQTPIFADYLDLVKIWMGWVLCPTHNIVWINQKSFFLINQNKCQIWSWQRQFSFFMSSALFCCQSWRKWSELFRNSCFDQMNFWLQARDLNSDIFAKTSLRMWLPY